MGSAWGPELYDFAAWNTAQVEEILLDNQELLLDDVDAFEWEKELDSTALSLNCSVLCPILVPRLPIRLVETGL